MIGGIFMTKKVKISLLLLVWGIALLQIMINIQERRSREQQMRQTVSTVQEITMHPLAP